MSAAKPIAIAIASGKGGVGKSTVAVNLCVVLAQRGSRVGLLDADVYGPNCHIMLGVDRMPPSPGTRMNPAIAHGLRVMSMGFLVKPGQPLAWRGPMLHSAIRQFVNDVEWGELDYLLVDLPPGTGDAQLSVAQTLALAGGVIVTLPQQVSVADAQRGLELFRQLKVPVLGVIENMSYLSLPNGERMEVFGSGGGARLAADTGVPFWGEVPMDPAVRAGGDSGTPVVISAPNSATGMALTQIALRMVSAADAQIAQQPDDFIPVEVVE